MVKTQKRGREFQAVSPRQRRPVSRKPKPGRNVPALPPWPLLLPANHTQICLFLCFTPSGTFRVSTDGLGSPVIEPPGTCEDGTAGSPSGDGPEALQLLTGRDEKQLFRELRPPVLSASTSEKPTYCPLMGLPTPITCHQPSLLHKMSACRDAGGTSTVAQSRWCH